MATQQNELVCQFHTRNFQLLKTEQKKIDASFETLRRHLKGFGLANLHFYLEGIPRRSDFSVKAVLFIRRRTLITRSRDPLLLAACDQCIRKLADLVADFKEQMVGDSIAPRTTHRRARAGASRTPTRKGRSAESRREMFENESARAPLDLS
jgi:hypothetical protein